MAVFGSNVMDGALWRPAFEVGLAQAPAVVEIVTKAWLD
jgi:NTE family protein